MSELYRSLVSAVYRLLPGGRRHCVVCDSQVWRFLPYRGGAGSQPSLMNVLHVVGSDLDNYLCPRCGSHDRERHLIFYLSSMEIFAQMEGSAVLHFAPEKHLSQRIVAAQPAQYVRGDLYPTDADIQKLDLVSLPFADSAFDFLLANHVLEHVYDDLGAIAEILRVLRPGGMAILQTPFSGRLEKTWEDAGIDTDDARLQAYGQEDHVRLYGKDIFHRFSRSGLVSRAAAHADRLPFVDAWREGLNASEPFFLFQKPG